MREIHGATTEKIGTGLVCSVETFKGGDIKLVKRTSGFNGLSIYSNGNCRKIEIKTMEKSDYWIAINGFTAIDKLFFDDDYWLYYVLMPENIVVMTKALPFIKQQMKLAQKFNFLKELREWVKSTKRLSKNSGLTFVPRINIKFSLPIRELVAFLQSKDYDKSWNESVIEIWRNKASWKRLFTNENDC